MQTLSYYQFEDNKEVGFRICIIVHTFYVFTYLMITAGLTCLRDYKQAVVKASITVNEIRQGREVTHNLHKKDKRKVLKAARLYKDYNYR